MTLDDIKSEIDNSPTVPPKQVVSDLVDKLFNLPEIGKESLVEFSDTLLSLIYKISELYDSLSDEQIKKILEWIDECWNEEDFELVDSLLTVLANLPASSSKSFLINLQKKTNNSDVLYMIGETLNEL